jgi:hypothetical protein
MLLIYDYIAANGSRLGVVAVNLAQKFNSSTNVQYSTNVQ